MSKEIKTWIKQYETVLSDKEIELLSRATETIEKNVWDGESPWYPFRCVTPFGSDKNMCGIWNWDTAFHAMTVSRWDTELAKECLDGFMNFQLPDGMFPDVINANGFKELRFGKPPVLATACETVYKRCKDKLFLKRAYTRLVNFEKFMCDKRKFLGLFFYDASLESEKDYDLFVRYESGWDNSVRWDDPCVNYWPTDLNCFMIMMYRSMSYIADELHDFERTDEWNRKGKELEKLVNERLWNDKIKAYTDTNRYNGHKSEVLTPASFMPLYIKIATEEYAEFMKEHAENKNEFYPGMPTVSYDNPEYSRNYWRGPTWLNVAYFAAKGLKNYGFEAADDIKKKILHMVDKNKDAIYENYDSITEDGLSARNFAWSACFTIEFILEW